ncbi:LOW QUALITY PROTEIN: hypothetical protein PHMEG_00018632 [Phytophthora megakarya]|uniref:Uncharacterized protein n=1 Tax=Phytophthora megakarya TaxID=4795 RepID=A0A225VTY6_9STRA|nr:LOW QUALITY PROTEIN: hypothetical protein PHMEG_00018632 [Phytophthora megakarya]
MKCQMIVNLQTMPVSNQFITVQSIWHFEIYMNIYLQTGKIWKYTSIRSHNFLSFTIRFHYRERNLLLEAETSYKHDALVASVDTLHQLNADQKAVFDKMTPVEPENRFYWKHSSHTFGKKDVALAVAGCGVAAQLLTGGGRLILRSNYP